MGRAMKAVRNLRLDVRPGDTDQVATILVTVMDPREFFSISLGHCSPFQQWPSRRRLRWLPKATAA